MGQKLNFLNYNILSNKVHNSINDREEWNKISNHESKEQDHERISKNSLPEYIEKKSNSMKKILKNLCVD